MFRLYCRGRVVHISNRGGPATVNGDQHIAGLKPGSVCRRTVVNLDNRHTARVQATNGFPQTQPPDTQRRQHAMMSNLWTEQAAGKVLEQVAYLIVDWLEGHLVGLIINRCLVAGKECKTHESIDPAAGYLFKCLEHWVVENNDRQLGRCERANLELVDLSFAPHS